MFCDAVAEPISRRLRTDPFRMQTEALARECLRQSLSRRASAEPVVSMTLAAPARCMSLGTHKILGVSDALAGREQQGTAKPRLLGDNVSVNIKGLRRGNEGHKAHARRCERCANVCKGTWRCKRIRRCSTSDHADSEFESEDSGVASRIKTATRKRCFRGVFAGRFCKSKERDER